MSRGPGKWQLKLLARIARLKAGEQFALTDLATTPGKPSTDEYDALRRAAFQLAGVGKLRIDGEGRGMVVRPPLDPPKSDTYKFAGPPVSDTYRGAKGPGTSGRDKRRKQSVSVGTAADLEAEIWRLSRLILDAVDGPPTDVHGAVVRLRDLALRRQEVASS